jgi:hypothetical protein
MTGTWQHGRADAKAHMEMIESLASAAEIPPTTEQRLLLKAQTREIAESWRAGTLPLPEIRAFEIKPGRVCAATRIADLLGLRIAAVDARTNEPVVIAEVFLASPRRRSEAG